MRRELEEIEREQSFEELAVLRNVVMGRVKRERDLAEVRERERERRGEGVRREIWGREREGGRGMERDGRGREGGREKEE